MVRSLLFNSNTFASLFWYFPRAVSTISEGDQKALSTQQHWDSRYAGGREDGLGEHEWFRSFKDLRPFLIKHLPSPAVRPRILHLGSGTSEIPRELYGMGYVSPVSVDFSPVAINNMRETCKDLDGLEWEIVDVRNMVYKNDPFDVAFDKGTLDAMLWGSLWDPEEEAKKNVGAYVDEVARRLKPGGRWLYVTFRQPHFIRPLLGREGVWSITVETLGGEDGSFEYFGWVVEKLEK